MRPAMANEPPAVQAAYRGHIHAQHDNVGLLALHLGQQLLAIGRGGEQIELRTKHVLQQVHEHPLVIGHHHLWTQGIGSGPEIGVVRTDPEGSRRLNAILHKNTFPIQVFASYERPQPRIALRPSSESPHITSQIACEASPDLDYCRRGLCLVPMLSIRIGGTLSMW